MTLDIIVNYNPKHIGTLEILSKLEKHKTQLLIVLKERLINQKLTKNC